MKRTCEQVAWERVAGSIGLLILCAWLASCRSAETLADDRVALRFEPDPVFGQSLTSVSCPETGTRFPTGGPLWRLNLHRDEGRAHRTVEPSGPVRVERQQLAGSNRLLLEWQAVRVEEACLRVRATFWLEGSRQARASIAVDWPVPHPDWRLTSVHFPVLSLAMPENSTGDRLPRERSFLVRGWEQGLMYRDPFRTALAQDGTALLGSHPGPHPLQVEAFGHQDLSRLLYIQTDDVEGYRKDFRSRGDVDRLELWIEHPAPHWDRAGNELRLPYEVRLGPEPIDPKMRDDPWHAVARAYRRWVEEEERSTILASGLLRPGGDRSDRATPDGPTSPRERIRGRTFTVHCRDTRQGELAPHDLSSRPWSYLSVLDRWQSFLGAAPEEMMGIFARWNAVVTDLDLARVPATPENAAPGLAAVVSEARRRGLSVVLGTTPIGTGEAARHFEVLVEPGGAAVHQLEPGLPVRRSEAVPGLVSVLACLGDRRAIAGYCGEMRDLLAALDLSGLYLDAFAGPPVRLCAGGHAGSPHPAGGGRYFHAGRCETLSRLRRMQSDAVLVSETLDELLLADLDGVSMLLGRNIAGGAPQGEWVRAVPLWSAVYHAYLPVLGFFSDSVAQIFTGAPRSLRHPDAWRYMMALHFLAGSRLGFADDLRNLAVPAGASDRPLSADDSIASEPADSTAASELGQFLRALYREQAPEHGGELLLWGDLELPPLVLDEGTSWREEPLMTLLAWTAYGQPTFVPVRLEGALREGGRIPAILSSHWRSRSGDGMEGWIFVNWTSQAAVLRCRLFPTSGLAPEASEWEQFGPGVGRWRGDVLELSLPPASVHRIELEPRRRPPSR